MSGDIVGVIPAKFQTRVAAQIIQVLEAAEFGGKAISFKTTLSLLTQAGQVLREIEAIEGGK